MSVLDTGDGQGRPDGLLLIAVWLTGLAVAWLFIALAGSQ
jgi:hypothetical protein